MTSIKECVYGILYVIPIYVPIPLSFITVTWFIATVIHIPIHILYTEAFAIIGRDSMKNLPGAVARAQIQVQEVVGSIPATDLFRI